MVFPRIRTLAPLNRICSPAALLRGVFALALLAPAPALSAQPAADPPVLSPGDQVRIVVWENAGMSGEFEVAADGTIAHPLYREVRVAGLPLPQVEAGVRRVVQTFEESPQLLVEPLFRVSVTGEVRQPNVWVLRPEATLLQAIARSGGPTERGRLDRVRLVRGGREQVLDLSRPELGHGQMPVRSGDQLRVERRSDVFRETLAPVASLVAAAAAVARLFIR